MDPGSRLFSRLCGRLGRSWRAGRPPKAFLLPKVNKLDILYIVRVCALENDERARGLPLVYYYYGHTVKRVMNGTGQREAGPGSRRGSRRTRLPRRASCEETGGRSQPATKGEHQVQDCAASDLVLANGLVVAPVSMPRQSRARWIRSCVRTRYLLASCCARGPG